MTGAARAAGRRRLRLRLLVVFLALLTLASVRQLLISPTAGQDFRAFYAGAMVLRAGGNPYDWSVLGRTEDALYNAPDHLQPGDPRYYDFQPLPAGPWLYLVLEPFSGWRWPVAFAVWTSLLFVLTIACAFVLLVDLGFAGVPLGLAALAVALSPIVFLNAFLGTATPLVFAGLSASLVLGARGRPLLAGVVLSLVWIKPNLGLMLPAVLALQQPAWRRTLAGLGLGTLALFAVAYAALGRGLVEWPKGILQLWQAVQGPQPDIASLHGLYYPLLGGWMKTAALVLVTAAITGYGVWALRRSPSRPLAGMTVLLLWLCAVPYAHSFDLLLLLPVVAILIGPTLRGLQDPLVEITLFALALFPILYFTGLHLGPLNGFAAIALVLCAVAWHRRILTPSSARIEVAA